jgi:hypothetical protein
MNVEVDQDQILLEIKDLIYENKNNLSDEDLIYEIKQLVWKADFDSMELIDELDEIFSILNDFSTENLPDYEQIELIKKIFENQSNSNS